MLLVLLFVRLLMHLPLLPIKKRPFHGFGKVRTKQMVAIDLCGILVGFFVKLKNTILAMFSLQKMAHADFFTYAFFYFDFAAIIVLGLKEINCDAESGDC